MADSIKILYKEGNGEITEKKSRFIATLRPVSDLDSAMSFIEEIRKKNWDARHNCYAFTIGDNHEITRCSDDGEPSGTAGRPMLEVLMGEGVHNAAVVVTRYFGGVLLGTGGLVRAYQAAVKEGLDHCSVIEKTAGDIWEISCNYSSIGKLQYIMASEGVIPLATDYASDIIVKAALSCGSCDNIIKEITEGLNGNVSFKKGEAVSYAVLDGKTIILKQ
ncbi:MAG: YigZ family protein [Lachnospiraceae bacterium]|nr:YigZ family protein [Lachnospiraceae bacterium]